MSLIKDIKNIIQERDETITDLYLATNVKGNTCSIFQYGGIDDLINLEGYNGLVLQRPNIQIRVQDKSYEEGYEKINKVRNILNKISKEITMKRYILNIQSIANINNLGRDKEGYYVFTANFKVEFYDKV